MTTTMPLAALQIALCLGLPAGVLWLEPRSRIVRWLSPVIVCYLLGMALGNQPWVALSSPLALRSCDVTVALAIPLLLFSVDVRGWLRLARPTVISFVLVMVAAVVAGAAGHLLVGGGLPESPAMAGMLVGVYIGGTPNMAAIGSALQVRPETFVLLNAADMVASFAYLLFILGVAPRLLARVLPPTPRPPTGPTSNEGPPAEDGGSPRPGRLPLGDLARALALTSVVVAVTLGVRSLMPPSARDAVAMLTLTTLSVAAALHGRVRALKGTQPAGQFLLLVFCVAMGVTTDFAELFGASPQVLIFTAVVLTLAVALHLLMVIPLRIDRDTAIITSVAGIFGPHMVGPAVVSLNNRAVLMSGLASGLVGYAAGNYLGVLTAWMLR